MPHIPSAEAPVFNIIPGTTFTGLAAPSRGSKENAVWRVTVEPGTSAQVHQLTREEILIVTAGSAMASISGSEISFSAGDALVGPLHRFQPRESAPGGLRGDRRLPVGARAMIEGGEPFVPRGASKSGTP